MYFGKNDGSSEIVQITSSRQVFQEAITQAAAKMLEESTRLELEAGLERLEERPFCGTCPGALICAAAEVKLENTVPDLHPDASQRKRHVALKTLGSMSISLIGNLENPSMCFGKVIRAVDRGILLPASSSPSDSDPLEPGTLLHLADRVLNYVDHIAARINTGQRI